MNKSIALTMSFSHADPAGPARSAHGRIRGLIRALIRVLDHSERAIRRLSVCLAAVGVLLMLTMLVMICANISLRPFGSGIRGTVEAGGYLCALAVGLCMPGAQFAGSHISVGLRENRLPVVLRRLQEFVVNGVSALLLFFAGREVLSIAEYSRDMGEYIEGFNIPYYAMAAGLAAGLFVHALIFAHMLASTLLGRNTGRNDKEAV